MYFLSRSFIKFRGGNLNVKSFVKEGDVSSQIETRILHFAKGGDANQGTSVWVLSFAANCHGSREFRELRLIARDNEVTSCRLANVRFA